MKPMSGDVLAAPDADVSPVAEPSSPFADNALTRAIDRFRIPLFTLVALLMLLSFNGQWRIGLDSANYRGLADSLANGRGYTFGAWAPTAIYPGWPVMLAIMQKTFGTGALVPCIAMNLMSIAILLLTYRLIRLEYPRWVAVAVTFGVGSNSWFLQLGNELLTDIPFLLGVMIALYGWERLRLSITDRSRAKWIAIAAAGLLLAGLMRPTFWIVILAWGLVSVWGLIRGPRKLSAISLVVLFAVFALFVALDPRSHGFHPFGGSPERQAMNLLTEGPETIRVLNDGTDRQPVPTTHLEILWQKTRYILHDQLPTAFFGQRIAPFSILASLIVIGSSLLLCRHPLWLTLVLLTFLVTVLLSAEPRYYIMVLPLLSLGWILMLDRLMRITPGVWGIVLASALMFLFEGNNLARAIPVILEQRATPFLKHYRRGDFVPLIALAEEIRKTVPPNGNVLGPSGSVLSYFSGRHVWTQREVLYPDARGRIHETDLPRQLAELHFAACVFPSRLYWDKEPTIARIMERRIIVAMQTLYATEHLSLATVEVHVPHGDWRKLPKAPPKVVRPPKHKKKKPTTTSASGVGP